MPRLDGKSVSLRFKSLTYLAFERIARLRRHTRRAEIIRYLAAEAAYAVEDFIDQAIDAGMSEREISKQIGGGWRFEFTPCSNGPGVRRRGLQRELDAEVIERLLQAQT